MPQPLYICGSTASGKSGLALELARKYHLEVLYLTPPDDSETGIISRLRILLQALKACS